jgi:hypothetical protein
MQMPGGAIFNLARWYSIIQVAFIQDRPLGYLRTPSPPGFLEVPVGILNHFWILDPGVT